MRLMPENADSQNKARLRKIRIPETKPKVSNAIPKTNPNALNLFSETKPELAMNPKFPKQSQISVSHGIGVEFYKIQ